jgi:hypothetical protein
MTPCPDLVAEAAKSRPNAPRFDNHRADHSPRAPSQSTPVLVELGPEAPEMNITGTHMLLALAIAFCLAGPLAWAFLKYWLFAL